MMLIHINIYNFYSIQKDGDNGQLIELLSLSDLLAVTCEGEHKHAEDLCHEIFEIDELIR